MPFTNTFQALSIIATGLWVVCASVYGSAGWTAPPCLAAIVISGASVLLGGITDFHEHKKANARPGTVRPTDKRSNMLEMPNICRVHDDGWLELYEGRMAELWTTNQTYTFANMDTGYVHNAAVVNNRLVVRTDAKQIPHTLGRQTTNRHRNAEIPMLGRPETFLPPVTGMRKNTGRRITSAEFQEEVSSYFFSGSGLHDYRYTKSLGEYVGHQIANKAYELGTYCMTVSASSSTEATPYQSPYAIANIGIAVEGPVHSHPIQPACAG